MIRNLYNKYCCGYDRLEEEVIPLKRMSRHCPPPTTQPFRSNRWYASPPSVVTPSPIPPLGGEVSVVTRACFPQPPTPTWNPIPANQGTFVCFTEQQNGGMSSNTLYYNTPYQYYYQQSTLRATGYTEQGRVIGNPLVGGAQTHSLTNTQTSLSPAAQQFVPNRAGIPYNNPYFEMNNLRHQMSGLGGYGACPGNPFLTPNHFTPPYNTNTFNQYQRPDKNNNVHTNTTLHLTNMSREHDNKSRGLDNKSRGLDNKSRDHDNKSRDQTVKSRDQGTETTLVLGSKKRNRAQRLPVKRPTEHLAAPGAERTREVQQSTEGEQSEGAVETGQDGTLQLNIEEQLVLEIKVQNSGEMILDSMRESPAEMISQEQVKSDSSDNRSTCSISRDLTQPTFAQVLSISIDQAVDSPIRTTSIEEIFTEQQNKLKESSEHETKGSSTTKQAQKPLTPLSPGPLTPLTPQTPLSPGFEWCEEYEYELVDHTEHEMVEEEEAMEIDLNFELDSPQSVNSPVSAE